MEEKLIKKERKPRAPNKNKIDYTNLTHIVCHDCGENKPKSEYYKNKYSYCKVCWNKRNTGYNKNRSRDKKREEKVVKNEPKAAINSEHLDSALDLDFTLFDSFSNNPTPEQIEEERIEKEIELYKKELLNAELNEEIDEEEPQKCIINAQKMYSVVDDDEILYHLNPNSDLTMREQIEELRLKSGIIYQNKTEIGVFDGLDFVWYGVDKRFVSMFTKKPQPITKYKLVFCDNTVEIMSAREFMVKYRQSTAPRTGKHEKYSKKDNELTEYGKIGLECVETIRDKY